MSSLKEKFMSYEQEIQNEILRLGFQCWDLIQEESLRKRDLDMASLLDNQREEGKEEGRREEATKYKKIFLEQDIKIDSLTSKNLILQEQLKGFERTLQEKEDKLRMDFEKQKSMIVKQTQLEDLQTFQEKINAYEKTIAKLEAKQDWQQVYEREHIEKIVLQTQLQDMKKSKTSFTLGKEGEAEIHSLLSQIHEWDFEEVHQEPGKADFRAVNKEKKTFILDAKNYSRAVPKQEREKISRDVDNDSSVLGGILVSLHSKVHTKEHCEIELTPMKKPICYLVLDGMSDQAKCVCVASTLRLMLQYVASNDQREKDSLIDKIQQAFLRLREYKSETENQRNKAKELYESLKVSVEKIQGLLDYLQDKPLKETSVEEKKPRGKKKSVSTD
jgi:hypothetical protein